MASAITVYVDADLDSAININSFELITVKELKNFLADRGVQRLSSRSKKELVALAYAWQSVRVSAAVQPGNRRHCNVITGFKHPHELDNWFNENNGVQHWPPVYLDQVAKFLLDKDAEALIGRIQNKYKQLDDYGLFAQGWLGEVFYHPVEEHANYCFVKSSCFPHMKIHNDDYKMWAVIEKQTGDIITAYCECIAGQGERCKHVGAMLMKIMEANRSGVANATCTSLPCKWTRPSNKQLKMNSCKRIVELNFSSPSLLVKSKKLKSTNPQIDPHSLAEARNTFLVAAEKNVPGASFFAGISSRVVVDGEYPDTPIVTTPPTLRELAVRLSERDMKSQKYSEEDMAYITMANGKCL